MLCAFSSLLRWIFLPAEGVVMPVFISYSHADREFVEKIAAGLVRANVHVWVDRWELQLGDSIIDKIQKALADASVLLIMLSKSSVASEWCKKGLNAGLIRELEERRVVTIPVILDDCEVPLFLRDKYHADFRNDFDQELKRLQDSLLKYTDISLNRVENLKYHIDWAIDHGIIDDHVFINVDSISFSKEHEYSVLCNIMVVGNSKATALYKLAHSKGEACAFIDEFVSILLKMSPRPDFHVLLDSNLPQHRRITAEDPRLGYAFEISISARRLGINNGFDLLFDYGSILEMMLEKRQAIVKKGVSAK